MFKNSKILQKIRDRRNDGFTIVEAVITIPMLALVGGTLFLFMAQSILLINQNNTAAVAANEVNVILDDVRNVETCNDLKNMVSPEYIKNEEKGYYIEVKPFIKGQEDAVDAALQTNLEIVQSLVVYLCTPYYDRMNTDDDNQMYPDSSLLMIVTARELNSNSDDPDAPDKVLFSSSAQSTPQGIL